MLSRISCSDVSRSAERMPNRCSSARGYPRVRSRASARSAIWRVPQTDLAVGVHGPQDVFGIWVLQSGVEVEAPLKARLHQRQIARRDTGRDDDLEPVGRKLQQGAQRLVQFGILDLTGLDREHVLEIVQQHHRPAARKGLHQGLHSCAGGGLRVLVDGIELLDRFVWQQLGEAGIQVGDVHAVERTRGTEIDNAIDRQGPAVVGKLAALQRTQQPADHCRFADAAPSDHGHQSQRFVLKKLADLPCLEVTVLKPGGGDQRRRVNELAMRDPADRLGGLALAFQPDVDALLDPLLRCLGVVDDLLLLSDLPLQFGDVFPDARLLLRLGTWQLALGIRQTVLEGLELPVRRVHPGQVLPEPGQPLSQKSP